MKRIKLLMTTLVMVATLMVASLASAAGFSDVKSTHWAYNAINWAVEKGITNGFPDDSFRPSDKVSEEQFLSMLMRSYGDVPEVNEPPYWSLKYYVKASSLNYPLSNNRSTLITRTWVAEIISGTQGKNYAGIEAIKFMLENGLANGKQRNTVDGYAGNDTLTRAEAVTFISNVVDKRSSDRMLPRPNTPSISVDYDRGIIDPDIKKIGDKEDQVQKSRAEAVAKAVKGSGFEVFYNTSQSVMGISDKRDKVFFTYTNNGYKDPDYGIVIKYDHLVDDGSDVMNKDYVNAVMKAMNALGMNVGEEFKIALDKADWDGKETSFKIKGKKFYITPINIGRGVISE